MVRYSLSQLVKREAVLERYRDKPYAVHHPVERDRRCSTGPDVKHARDTRNTHRQFLKSDSKGGTWRRPATNRFRRVCGLESPKRACGPYMVGDQALGSWQRCR